LQSSQLAFRMINRPLGLKTRWMLFIINTASSRETILQNTNAANA